MKLFHRPTNSEGLTNSSLHDEKSFFAAFSRDFKRVSKEVIIESPYLTVRRVSQIAPLCAKLTKKGVVVHVYTRNPSHHDESLRRQAVQSIELLESAGVKVTTCNDMRHRKLASIDGHILWEGSLNMLSHSNSKEIMRRTESREMCLQMLKFTGLVSSVKW